MWVTGAESKDPDKLSLAMLPQGILSIMPSPGVFLIAASFEPSRPLYRENALLQHRQGYMLGMLQLRPRSPAMREHSSLLRMTVEVKLSRFTAVSTCKALYGSG